MGRCRLRHACLVVLFFVLTTGFYTFPLAFRPGDTLLIGLGDYLTETSMVAWNALQVFRDPGRLFQVPFYYPYGSGVAYQQSAFFTGLLAAPILWAGAEPVQAVNLLLLAGLVASGALAYLLAYSLTNRVGPSLLAGVVFAFYPNRMDHLGQFTYQQAVLCPLVVWAWHRFLLGGRWRDVLLAGAALWAQALSSLYNAYALLVLLTGLTVAVLVLRPERLTRSSVGKALAVGLGLALALAPFARPYLAVHRELGFQRQLGEAESFGMDLLSILDPGVFNRLYHDRLLSLGRSEGGMFPGFVPLGLAVAALGFAVRGPAGPSLPVWARRFGWVLAGAAFVVVGKITLALAVGKIILAPGGVELLKVTRLTTELNLLPTLALGWIALEGRRRRRGPLTAREWTVTLLALAVLTYLLCLAPTLWIGGQAWGTTLFRWMYLHAPGASAFRAPGRWSLVFVLPLALLAAFGARAVADWLPRPWARASGGLLLAGLLAEYVVVPVPWDRLPPLPAVYEWLRAEPGDFAVLQVPLYEGASDAWAMLWAIHHGKRVVNGHGGFALPTWTELVTAAQRRDADRLSTALQSVYPLRYVIVHPALLGPTWRPMWDRIRRGEVASLRRVRTVGVDEVYAVAGTPQAGSEVRRHFGFDFVRGHPQAEYALRLAGDDAEVFRRVEVRLNGRLLRTHAGPARERVDLPPPFPVADRSELSFRHVYDVPAALARTGAYRIGGTDAHSPVDIEVRSGGKTHGNVASIRVNGHELVPDQFRGYWVAALAPADGRVLGIRRFDTHETVAESARLAAYVEGQPAGAIVVVAALDEAGWQLTEQAVHAFRSVGGRGDLRGTFGLSHLVVGVRGASPGAAVEAWGARELHAVVGRARPIGVLLEAFDLR